MKFNPTFFLPIQAPWYRSVSPWSKGYLFLIHTKTLQLSYRREMVGDKFEIEGWGQIIENVPLYLDYYKWMEMCSFDGNGGYDL